MRLAFSQRELLTDIVLLNRSLSWWCGERPGRNPQVEMGRLLGALDTLTEHFGHEVEQAITRGVVA